MTLMARGALAGGGERLGARFEPGLDAEALLPLTVQLQARLARPTAEASGDPGPARLLLRDHVDEHLRQGFVPGGRGVDAGEVEPVVAVRSAVAGAARVVGVEAVAAEALEHDRTPTEVGPILGGGQARNR